MEGCGTVPKILLVEDNQAAVVKIRQFIENIDTVLELLTCKEAGAAYILAQKQKVDLFILDIQLKDYKGTSLAAQLRGLPEYKYTPIIFESALAGEELSAYREVKCYGFLIKPYTEAEFRAVPFVMLWDFPLICIRRKNIFRLSRSSLFWTILCQKSYMWRRLGKNLPFIPEMLFPE